MTANKCIWLGDTVEMTALNLPSSHSNKTEEPSPDSCEHWCAIPGELFGQYGAEVWLNEPEYADRIDLVDRLLDGYYDKPFIVDDGITRRLHFDFKYSQSEMSVSQPYDLVSAYTRKMMAFMLFTSKPKDIVIVGLGGGALTKFNYRQLPKTRITTVEVNADVIALSELFELPGQDSRMTIVHADAAEYFATADRKADVILLDGCDKTGIAPTFKSTSFYQNLRARLRPHGVLALNLIGQSDQLSAHLKLLSNVFSNNLLVTDVSCSTNRIAFAFKDAEFCPDWERIKIRANKLEYEHGLDFPRFARLLQSSHKRYIATGQW